MTWKSNYIDHCSGVNKKKEIVVVDHSVPKAGTIENVLMWARNRKNDVHLYFPIALLL